MIASWAHRMAYVQAHGLRDDAIFYLKSQEAKLPRTTVLDDFPMTTLDSCNVKAQALSRGSMSMADL